MCNLLPLLIKSVQYRYNHGPLLVTLYTYVQVYRYRYSLDHGTYEYSTSTVRTYSTNTVTVTRTVTVVRTVPVYHKYKILRFALLLLYGAYYTSIPEVFRAAIMRCRSICCPRCLSWSINLVSLPLLLLLLLLPSPLETKDDAMWSRCNWAVSS